MNTFEIQQDSFPQNPRAEWDNTGTMVCWSRRYTLGDSQPSVDPIEYTNTIPKGSVVLPLYLYSHSGITMKTTPFACPWDSGQVGFIYMTPENIRKDFGVKMITKKVREKCEKLLVAEVAVYDAYISDDVWMIVEKDESGEVVDSNGGYYGYDDAKEAVKESQKRIQNL